MGGKFKLLEYHESSHEVDYYLLPLVYLAQAATLDDWAIIRLNIETGESHILRSAAICQRVEIEKTLIRGKKHLSRKFYYQDIPKELIFA